MKKIILIIFIFFSVQALFADEIHLNSGKVIKGRIIRVTKNAVEYDPHGEIPFNIIKRENVAKIRYESGLEVLITGDDSSSPAEKINESSQPKREFDEIHLLDGRKFRGAVLKITTEYIEFIPERKKMKDLLPRGQVSKIVYKNGKVIFFQSTGSGGSKRANLNNESQSGKGAYEHDGFMFRFIWGYGPADATVENFNGSDLVLEGINGMMRFQLGYSFTSNISLFIDNGAVLYNEPDVTWNDTAQENTGTEYSSSQLGIGLSYYLMPSNIYFALSVSFVVAEFKGDLINTQEVYGTGYFASIGKEWWVSKNWGLGVAIYYYQEKLDIDDSDFSEKYNVENKVWGIAFTATYN